MKTLQVHCEVIVPDPPLTGGLDLEGLPYVIKYTKKYGRGLYATVPIAEDTVIIRAPVIHFSVEDTVLLQKTSLRHYTFANLENPRVDAAWLPLGHAILINHAEDNNVTWMMFNHVVADFVAVRDIKVGEQLCSHYGHAPVANSRAPFAWLNQ